MLLIGGAASALALFKLAGPFLLGFPEKLIPIVILSLGFLFLSLIAFIWGLIKWNNSSSELNALGVSPPKARVLRKSPEQMRPEAKQSSIAASARADPITSQGSVTEHTTHLLEEDNPEPTPRPVLGERQ